jgi:ribosomal protein L31
MHVPTAEHIRVKNNDKYSTFARTEVYYYKAFTDFLNQIPVATQCKSHPVYAGNQESEIFRKL